MQLFATVLADVGYRLYGEVVGGPRSGPINRRHHLQDLFDRRIGRGQCHRTPCLGWSEFTCSYWGPFRVEETEVDVDLSLEIPSMLHSIWDSPVTAADSPARYEPRFTQGSRDLAGRLVKALKVENGVLEYDRPDGRRREGGDDAQ